MIRFSFIIVCCLVLVCAANGQSRRKGPNPGSRPKQKQEKFLEKQWWLGFKAGPNLTQVTPTQRYAIVTPTNYSPALLDKKYDGFKKIGSQATLEVSFYFKGFSISVQPTYRHNRFTYSNDFSWTNPLNPDDQLSLTYLQEQHVDNADLPLLVKYDITGNRMRPYIQGGIFYSRVLSATKSVEVKGTDQGSGGVNEFASAPVIVGAKDLFHKSYWGLLAGAGLNYNLGNVRLILDASYRIGMSNITNTKNRFSNDRLNGIGDAQDDMKMNNIIVSIGCLFPMRFLSTNFKALDR